MTTTWLHDHMRKRANPKTNEGSRAQGARQEPTHQAQPGAGGTTLDLIHQAAEAFQDIQARMAETEARAQAMLEEAAEKLQRALERLQASEAELRKADQDLDQANVRIREADEALEQAQSRAAKAESELCAMEIRLKATEQREHEMREAFDRVERAIRTTLFASVFAKQRAAA
jgi:chromosome segregation ATPase